MTLVLGEVRDIAQKTAICEKPNLLVILSIQAARGFVYGGGPMADPI